MKGESVLQKLIQFSVKKRVGVQDVNFVKKRDIYKNENMVLKRVMA